MIEKKDPKKLLDQMVKTEVKHPVVKDKIMDKILGEQEKAKS
ncbi:hypothetical protein [Solibacillus sp. FSL H8-0538]